jgi:hypothetical protein
MNRAGVAALVLGLLAPALRADVVADYRRDFAPNGPATTGWSYRWNAFGAIELTPNILNEAALAGLLRDASGNFETLANGVYPDLPPASGLAATPTSMIPGQSATEAGDGASRWVLASYTIKPADIIINGSSGVMRRYSFSVPESSADGVTARMYLNATRVVQSPLPPDFTYDQDSPGSYPIPFGELKAGDVITVALGAGLSSAGDRLDLDYSITLEPGLVTPNPVAAADMTGDGQVSIADYFRIDRGFALNLAGFENGDLDGTGQIDLEDFRIIDWAFRELNGATTPARPAAGGPLVPEPGSLLLLATMAGLLRRPRASALKVMGYTARGRPS